VKLIQIRIKANVQKNKMIFQKNKINNLKINFIKIKTMKIFLKKFDIYLIYFYFIIYLLEAKIFSYNFSSII
jgi:hypothetical protein